MSDIYTNNHSLVGTFSGPDCRPYRVKLDRRRVPASPYGISLKDENRFLHEEAGAQSREIAHLKDELSKLRLEMAGVASMLGVPAHLTGTSLKKVLQDRKMELLRSRESVLEWQKAHARAERTAQLADEDRDRLKSRLLAANSLIEGIRVAIGAKPNHVGCGVRDLVEAHKELLEQLALTRDEASVAWQKCREWEAKHENQEALHQAASEESFSLYLKIVDEREEAKAQCRQLMKRAFDAKAAYHAWGMR